MFSFYNMLNSIKTSSQSEQKKEKRSDKEINRKYDKKKTYLPNKILKNPLKLGSIPTHKTIILIEKNI